MVNIRTRVAAVNMACSTLRKAATFECKKLQNTTLSENFFTVHWAKYNSMFLHYQTFSFVSEYLETIRGLEPTLKSGLLNKIW